jgi:hypothetical protein
MEQTIASGAAGLRPGGSVRTVRGALVLVAGLTLFATLAVLPGDGAPGLALRACSRTPSLCADPVGDPYPEGVRAPALCAPCGSGEPVRLQLGVLGAAGFRGVVELRLALSRTARESPAALLTLARAREVPVRDVAWTASISVFSATIAVARITVG